MSPAAVESVRTGVFATADELREAKTRAVDARTAPVVRVYGIWLHESAWEAFACWLDALAVSHGLPPPPVAPEGDVDHYGLLGTGEFTRRGQP